MWQCRMPNYDEHLKDSAFKQRRLTERERDGSAVTEVQTKRPAAEAWLGTSLLNDLAC